MHEMSYVIRFVNLAEETARAEHARRVVSITVEVGETSGVLPEYLQKYYPDAVKGTLLEGSRLLTVSVPVEAVCADCGTHYHPERSNNYSCPVCHGIHAKIISGRGVRLQKVEVETGESDREILVCSFGTSFNESRKADIGGIETAVQKAFPKWTVRRAFSSGMIIRHILNRDGEEIDGIEQALQRAADNGVRDLVILPTHLMYGIEYDKITRAAKRMKDRFERIGIASPLLGEAGTDDSGTGEEKTVLRVITEDAVRTAGYGSITDAEDDGTAFVFMGHGTAHEANAVYDQMQKMVRSLGYENVFIGTVEGKPEDTACRAVIDKVKAGGYKKVVLRPLMVVAGDHANNDMAGEDNPDSWVNQFRKDGTFDSLETQIIGLGRLSSVQQIYIAHAAEIISEMP